MGAQLSIAEMRRGTRHPVDFATIADHRERGELSLRLINLSAQGFMVAGDPGLGLGERLVVRLPSVGRIEAHRTWTTAERTGFQFERILRHDDFALLIAELQPNPDLRRRA